MIDLRPFDSLGTAEHGWLSARHHFSFADYLDRARMGLGKLRVWNDDRIKAGTGFPPHPHRDMEIITFVRSGAITHEDNLGNRGRTEAGQVQVMSAGTGIMHAEWNEETVDTEIFQIWILPAVRGVEPRWETRPFPREPGVLEVMAAGTSPTADRPVLFQDAGVLAGTLSEGQTVTHRLDRPNAYLVPAKGAVTVNGLRLDARAGAAITGEERLEIVAESDAELVLVETA